MKKYLFVNLLFAFAISISASAQKKKFRFHSINTVGLISGESTSNIGFQTINGIHFSNWFTGIGIGIDKYKYKTLPLFADGMKFFGNEKRAFAYGDIGYNFPMNDKPGKEFSYYNTYHFSGGIYTGLGIGYQAPLSKKTSIIFSFGYSYKQLNSKTSVTLISPFMGSDDDYNNYKFTYSTVILKAGIVF
jgi:hypothetical protein